MTGLVLNNVKVKVKDDMWFCASDIFKASGSLDKNKPNKFRRNKGVQLFEDALKESNPDIQPVITDKTNNGTEIYMVKEMVYKYAAWIDPNFEVMVYKVFDMVKNGDEDLAAYIVNGVSGIEKKYQERQEILAMPDSLEKLNKLAKNTEEIAAKKSLGGRVLGFKPREISKRQMAIDFDKCKTQLPLPFDHYSK